MLIKSITAKQIKNSRKQSTIQVTIKTSKTTTTASAPSGASTGKREIKIFPKGIKYAINYLKKLKNIEINNFNELKKIEKLTKKIGANPTIALEFAIIKALAKENKLPLFKYLNKKAKTLPTPLGNCIGGGAHFKGKSTDIQEFLILSPNRKFSQAAKLNEKIHKLLKKQFGNKQNDEGAWAPDKTNIEVLDYLYKLSKKYKFKIGLDIAASQFYKNKKYHYKNFSPEEKNKILSKNEQIKFVNNLIKKYNLYYIEDPLNEDDFKGFSKIKGKLIVGDDLTTTNPKYLKKAIKLKSINAIIVKPNQIGSLIITKQIVDLAKKHKITTIISHRSGETLDTTISHLAVAWNIPIIKCGIKGKEREIKIQELKNIERKI